VAAAGITAGCGDRRFCPNRLISRGEMAAFLQRAFAVPASAENFYTDDEGNTFEDSINAITAAGIAFGCTATTYCPAAAVTRGQMAAFIHRAIE
jgi:hypothetical protein